LRMCRMADRDDQPIPLILYTFVFNAVGFNRNL
jgi:hypothetical protein